MKVRMMMSFHLAATTSNKGRCVAMGLTSQSRPRRIAAWTFLIADQRQNPLDQPCRRVISYKLTSGQLGQLAWLPYLHAKNGLKNCIKTPFESSLTI
jgi:hypothetical protein